MTGCRRNDTVASTVGGADRPVHPHRRALVLLVRRPGSRRSPWPRHRPPRPLAEAWDSGASAWSGKRRERYANDLGDSRALVAVTARSNRQKSDQDVTEWLPDEAMVCRYVADWTAIKLRWNLTLDPVEQQTLTGLAANCPNPPVTVTTAD